MTGQCTSCGSKRLVHGHMAVNGFSASIGFLPAGASLVSRKPATSLTCLVCADCGNVQVVAAKISHPSTGCRRARNQGSLPFAE